MMHAKKKKKKYDHGGEVTGVRTRETYNRAAQDEVIRRINASRKARGKEPISEAEEAQKRAVLSDMRNLKSWMGEDYRPVYTGGRPHTNYDALKEAGKFTGTGIVSPSLMVEEILMSLPKKELKYRKGGKATQMIMNMMKGGMLKYQNGGEVPDRMFDEAKIQLVQRGGDMVRPDGPSSQEAFFLYDGKPISGAQLMERLAEEYPNERDRRLRYNEIMEGFFTQTEDPLSAPVEDTPMTNPAATRRARALQDELQVLTKRGRGNSAKAKQLREDINNLLGNPTKTFYKTLQEGVKEGEVGQRPPDMNSITRFLRGLEEYRDV